MNKMKWDDAEGPTIEIIIPIKLVTDNFKYAL